MPAASSNRITARSDFVADLIKRQAALAGHGFEALPDLTFGSSVEAPDAFNAMNDDRRNDAIASVLTRFAQNGVAAAIMHDLVKQLTEDKTALGFAAQLQAYAWLQRQGAAFEPEVHHAGTVRGKLIPLDGRFEPAHGGAFFEVKSYGFDASLRGVAVRRLEARLRQPPKQWTVTISGPSDHGSDAIQEHVFKQLPAIAQALAAGQTVSIAPLGWTISAKPRGGVSMSMSTTNVERMVREHEKLPLRYGSQFTTDAPFVSFFVIPYRFYGNEMEINVSGVTVRFWDGLVADLFGAGRTDTREAAIFDKTIPSRVLVKDVVACLSAVAFVAEPPSGYAPTELLYLNTQAQHRLTRDQAESISRRWVIKEL